MVLIPRLARGKLLGASFFHVIVQGHKKEYIFKKERYIYEYINLIKKYIKGTNLKIISYCIMNNHAHFLFQVKDIQELSKFFHKLNTVYARYYNYMEQDRVGHVYRDRFLSEPITSHKYLIQCIKYIHFNPVKARIVDKCEEYKFSLYKHFKKKLKEDKYDGILNKYDYEDICNNIDYDAIFLDIDTTEREKTIAGIQEFLKEKKYRAYEMFSNRKVLEEMVFYLKNVKKIKYKNIRDLLDMTRGTMQRIVIKNNKNIMEKLDL